jgi:hypothetical protein
VPCTPRGDRSATVLRDLRTQARRTSAADGLVCALRALRPAATGMTGVARVLEELTAAGLLRGLRTLQSPDGAIVDDHVDLDALADGLRRAAGGPCLVATDAAFSMDGDLAPLEGIVERRPAPRSAVGSAARAGGATIDLRGPREAPSPLDTKTGNRPSWILMCQSQVVPFGDAAMEAEAPGIRSRAVPVNGVRWAVVSYEPGVLREEWCDEGHSGFVIDGEVVYEFKDGSPELRVQAEQGLMLSAGSGHRGRAGPEGVRLFLIDRAG